MTPLSQADPDSSTIPDQNGSGFDSDGGDRGEGGDGGESRGGEDTSYLGTGDSFADSGGDLFPERGDTFPLFQSNEESAGDGLQRRFGLSPVPQSERMLLDFGGWMGEQAPDLQAAWKQHMEALPDDAARQEAQHQLLNLYTVAEATPQVSPDDIYERWDIVRGGFAEQRGWEAVKDDEKGLYHQLREEAQWRQDKRTLLEGPAPLARQPWLRIGSSFYAGVFPEELRAAQAVAQNETQRENSLLNRVREAALTGQGVDGAFAQWQPYAAKAAGYDPAEESRYFAWAEQKYDHLAAIVEKVRPLVEEGARRVRDAREARPGTGADLTPFTLYGGHSPEEVRVAMELTKRRASGELMPPLRFEPVMHGPSAGSFPPPSVAEAQGAAGTAGELRASGAADAAGDSIPEQVEKQKARVTIDPNRWVDSFTEWSVFDTFDEVAQHGDVASMGLWSRPANDRDVTAQQLYYQWVYGLGPKQRHFDENSWMGRWMLQSDYVVQAMDGLLKKMKTTGGSPEGDILFRLGKIPKLDFLAQFANDAVRGANPARGYQGSIGGKVWVVAPPFIDEDGREMVTLQIYLSDTSSASSATHLPPKDKKKNGKREYVESVILNNPFGPDGPRKDIELKYYLPQNGGTDEDQYGDSLLSNNPFGEDGPMRNIKIEYSMKTTIPTSGVPWRPTSVPPHIPLPDLPDLPRPGDGSKWLQKKLLGDETEP